MDDGVVGCLCLVIASLGGFLQVRQQPHLTRESVMEGVLTTENLSQDNLAVEVLDCGVS